ncbi:hypothetical protein D3C72_2363800 [compost metagenome]
MHDVKGDYCLGEVGLSVMFIAINGSLSRRGERRRKLLVPFDTFSKYLYYNLRFSIQFITFKGVVDFR